MLNLKCKCAHHNSCAAHRAVIQTSDSSALLWLCPRFYFVAEPAKLRSVTHAEKLEVIWRAFGAAPSTVWRQTQPRRAQQRHHRSVRNGVLIVHTHQAAPSYPSLHRAEKLFWCPPAQNPSWENAVHSMKITSCTEASVGARETL